MNKINAKIVADSINPQGNRITSFILTYPRFIHSELMTHRMQLLLINLFCYYKIFYYIYK